MDPNARKKHIATILCTFLAWAVILVVYYTAARIEERDNQSILAEHPQPQTLSSRSSGNILEVDLLDRARRVAATDRDIPTVFGGSFAEEHDLAEHDRRTVQARDPRCFMERDAGPCKAFFRRYYFNRRKLACDVFFWGGCEGSVPFVTMMECRRANCAQYFLTEDDSESGH